MIKRMAIVALVFLACTFLLAFSVPSPVAYFLSMILLMLYVMISVIILLDIIIL